MDNSINVVPNKEQLINAIRANVPAFLLEQPIWIAYYYRKNKDGTYSKPPCKGYSVDPNEPSYIFDHVINDGFPGIRINEDNNLVAIDVDDKEAKAGKRPFSTKILPKEFKAFLNKHKSYTEISPSNCGLRTLFVCDDKSSLPGRANLNEKLCLGGELFANSGYVTLTGRALRQWDIKSIAAEDLLPWYKKNGHPAEKEKDIIKADQDEQAKAFQQVSNLPSLNSALEAFRLCKLDQSAAVRNAYETVMGQSYNHYDFWFKIMSAIHHYMTTLGTDSATILANVLEWCQEDPVSYQDDDDVLDHWQSLGEQENPITYHTLFKIARLIKFNWPVEKCDKKGLGTGKPLVNELRNFKYLLDYFDITVYHEPYTKALYVSSDLSTIEKFFKTERTAQFFGKIGPFSEEELIFMLWDIAQQNHYDNVTLGTISPLAKAYFTKTVKEFNLMEHWLETPYNELPEDLKEPGTDPSLSTIDYVMDCIKFHPLQNKKLAKTYLNAFFFGIVMPMYNPERIWPEHNFMLIFTGPENCRKSTFFSSLIPKQFQEYLVTHSTETLSSAKSLRDFMIQMTSSALLVVDEFEIFYSKKNDSLFKTLVTCSSVDFVPIYSKVTKKTFRTAALAGTTNKQKLPLVQDSSRRVALIEVDFIDTDALAKVNWHAFYNKYIRKGKELIKQHVFPWKLKQSEINMQYEENERFRAPTELEYIMRELYDFDYPFPGLDVITSVQTESVWLASRSDIIATIKQKYPSMPIKVPALVNVLEQMCGKYSGTSRTAKHLPNCKGEVSKGVVTQKKYTRYIVPPRNTEFISE